MDRIGKYELQRFLGEGGFGRVYEAFDPALERRVAIKTCRRSGEEGEEDRERFLREARIAAKLDHENITKIFDLGYDEEHEVEYVVQEYLAGQDLQQMIHTRAAVPHAVRIHYLCQIAAGLEHAHRHHVVHRDVKPTNIRVLPDHRIKILDFGIAKEMAGDARGDLTGTGVTMGTLAYSAPEQIYSSRRADARADIFSFGVVAYELLAYKHPFPGGNLVHKIQHTEPLPLRDHWPECPSGLVQLVHSCLRKRRQERYQSFTGLRPVLLSQAAHFADELEAFLRDAPRLTSLSALVHERDVMPTHSMDRRYTTGRKLPPPPETPGSPLPISPLPDAHAPDAHAREELPPPPAPPRLDPASDVAPPISGYRLPRGLLLASLVVVVLTVAGLTWHSVTRTNASPPVQDATGAAATGAATAEAAVVPELPRLRLTLEVVEAGVQLRAVPPARPLAAKMERYQVFRQPAWSFGERQYIAGRPSAPLTWIDDRDLVPGNLYRYHVEVVSPERQPLARSSAVEVVYEPLSLQGPGAAQAPAPAVDAPPLPES